MLNIPEEEKIKWRSSSIHKDIVISVPNLNVTLTNDDLVLETIELKESINEGNALTFTGCIASEFSFTMHDVIQDLRSQYIEVTIAVDNETALPLFSGYVTTQDNLTFLDRQTRVTAFDSMTKIFDADVTSWYNALTFPITVKNFRDSFFATVNIIQSSATLANDNLTISEKTIKDAKISGELIVKAICQMNGVFGQIGRDGKFKYVELKEIVEGTYPAIDLYPGIDTFPADENANVVAYRNQYTSINYEPFITDSITKVSIRDQEGLEQGAYGPSDDNICVIADNPIIWAVNMQTAAQNIYDKLRIIQFMPTEVELLGYPYIECGDIICIHTNLNSVRTYVLNRTLTGVHALKDSFKSQSEKKLPEYQQSMSTMISSNGQSILKIQADIVEMNTLIADRATIGQLNAVSARVGSLEADHVTTAELNATNGRIDSLSAVAITTQNLSSQHISANQINAGKLSANYIDVDGVLSASSLRGRTITTTVHSATEGVGSFGTVSAGSLRLWNGSSYNTVTSNLVTISGTQYRVLCI